MFTEQSITKMHGAKWIGVPKDSYRTIQGNVLVYFRKTFVLEEWGKMEIVLSANNRYKLWVNGQRAGVGPCKGDRWRHYYDTLDVTPYLKKGLNVVGVEVMYYPPGIYGEGERTGPLSIVTNHLGPMLAVKGTCIDNAGSELADITTGGTDWLACVDQSITPEHYKDEYFMVLGAFENVQARKIPRGWKTDENPGGAWTAPIVKREVDGSGWGEFSYLPLMERPIPQMYQKLCSFEREMPIREEDIQSFTFQKQEKIVLPKGTKQVIELDAGELTTGYFQLHTEGGAGSRLIIRYAENYSKSVGLSYRIKEQRDDSLNFRLLGAHDTYQPSGGEDRYEPFWFRTFRFVRMEVEVGEEPLVLYRPLYVETGYPLEVSAEISSDAEWVKPLWEVSARTLQRCMHETYEDCPYYEQIQYSLDTRLEILFTYLLSGDTRLALKAIEDFHASITPEGILQSRAPADEPNIIPVFALYWIFMVEDYYWQTGDIQIARRLRPTMDAVLDWFDRRIGPAGLTERYYFWEFIDWVEEWQDAEGKVNGIPRASAQGPNTTSNLIYAAALKSAAELVERTGRKETAQEYRDRSNTVLKLVEDLCWCEERQMYREGPGIEEYSQHAQAWAVLTGLAEEAKAERILKNALKDEDVLKCTYVYSYYLFRALEKVGLYDLTQGLWDNWKDALKLGLTTWPEDLTRQRSDCHAWGSLPIYEFTRCMLGVQPMDPGWRRMQIKPVGLYVQNAKGKVMTQQGPVEVAWEKADNEFRIRGRVPAGVPFEVVLPDGQVFEFTDGGEFSIGF